MWYVSAKKTNTAEEKVQHKIQMKTNQSQIMA